VSLCAPRTLRVARIPGAERIVDGADEGWPLACAAAPWRHRARRAYVAAATMAVAAVLGIAASVLFWLAGRPSVGVVACPDVEAAPRATVAPVVERAVPVDPSDPRRDRVRRAPPSPTEDAPTGPDPSAKPRRPTPPGSMVAQRSRRGDARSRGVSRPVTMGGDPFPLATQAGERTPPQAIADADPRARSSSPSFAIPRAESLALASTFPVIPRRWSDERASDVWTRPASFGPAVAPASASWSLSPESSRWYGVGLPPSNASAGVPPGVGVMAQLDLGKALDAL
jgi:hypothetical protein